MCCRHYIQNGWGARCPSTARENGYCGRHKPAALDESIEHIFTGCSGRLQWSDIHACGQRASLQALAAVLVHLVPLADMRKRASSKKGNGKAAAAAGVTGMLECAWSVERSPRLLAAVRAFQRRFRDRFNGIVPENDTDPFTLEPISDMLKPFKYKDPGGKGWAFSGPHLLRWIETEHQNPFTREAIPVAEVGRLKRDFETCVVDSDGIRTPHDAFMDALYDIDHVGFYTKIEWFLALKRGAIIDLIFAFNEINRVQTPALTKAAMYTAIGNETDLHMHLAAELKRLVRAPSDRQFALICNLLVALAAVNPTARRELPQWIYGR